MRTHVGHMVHMAFFADEDESSAVCVFKDRQVLRKNVIEGTEKVNIRCPLAFLRRRREEMTVG